MIEALVVGGLYSNEEIYKSLKVSNAGGIRLSLMDKSVVRATIMTSVQDFHGTGENPYHDRLEGDILTYTAAGKLGQQTLSGVNHRVTEQKSHDFPIHGFVLVANRRDKVIGPKRWKYLGLFGIPSPLSGHAARRRRQGSQGLALRVQDSTGNQRSCHSSSNGRFRDKR